MKFALPALALVALPGVPVARAEVKLPAIFSDHMVVQADAAFAVWGWAAPGEEVTVTLAGQSATAKAGADGRWATKLGALPPTGEAGTLTVRGANTLTVRDVLVGEVWLASGQSNMEMQISGKEHGSVEHAEEEIAAAKFPGIRMFLPETPYSIYETFSPPAEPAADRSGAWRVCSPETAADFSALGYFFARDLHRQLGRPVGIVLAAVGGTPIEAWASLAPQQEKPEFAPLLADWQKRLANYDPASEQHAFLEKKTAWLKQRSDAVKQGQPAPKAPLPFKNLAVMAPAGLFNGVIAPLVPYTLRGCIWYQGERNALGPFTGLYGAQLKTLIADWRARWGADFYFAWVRAPLQKPLVPGAWVFPLFDHGNEVRLALDEARTLWSSYSKDSGRTWSEPRFLAAPADEAAFRGLEFRKSAGKTLRLTLEKSDGRKCETWLREDDLCRLATAEDPLIPKGGERAHPFRVAADARADRGGNRAAQPAPELAQGLGEPRRSLVLPLARRRPDVERIAPPLRKRPRRNPRRRQPRLPVLLRRSLRR